MVFLEGLALKVPCKMSSRRLKDLTPFIQADEYIMEPEFLDSIA
jgi:hypothetical protein